MITLRPGHGITPPFPLCYPRDNSDRPLTWLRQRPGGYPHPGRPGERWYEDDYTCELAADLVPALQAAGHQVVCQRALPGTAVGDDIVTLGPADLPQLPPDAPAWVGQRWRLCASAELALRGTIDPRDPCGWSWDPQMSCLAERQSPGSFYLSLHVNWYRDAAMHGIGAFAYDSSPRGQRAAAALLEALELELLAEGGDLAAWAAEDRHPWGSAAARAAILEGERFGIYRTALWELKQTRAPAVILELGFASHRPSSGPSDLDRITSPAGRAALVRGIVRGVTASGLA